MSATTAMKDKLQKVCAKLGTKFSRQDWSMGNFTKMQTVGLADLYPFTRCDPTIDTQWSAFNDFKSEQSSVPLYRIAHPQTHQQLLFYPTIDNQTDSGIKVNSLICGFAPDAICVEVSGGMSAFMQLFQSEIYCDQIEKYTKEECPQSQMESFPHSHGLRASKSAYGISDLSIPTAVLYAKKHRIPILCPDSQIDFLTNLENEIYNIGESTSNQFDSESIMLQIWMSQWRAEFHACAIHQLAMNRSEDINKILYIGSPLHCPQIKQILEGGFEKLNVASFFESVDDTNVTINPQWFENIEMNTNTLNFWGDMLK